jgi:hypothetical protein
MIKKLKVNKWFFKKFLHREQRKYFRRRISSPRASRLTLGEEFFAKSFFGSWRRNCSPRVLFFAENNFFLLSPKNFTLGKASVSCSDSSTLLCWVHLCPSFLICIAEVLLVEKFAEEYYLWFAEELCQCWLNNAHHLNIESYQIPPLARIIEMW